MEYDVHVVVKNDGMPDIIMPSETYFTDAKRRIQNIIGLAEQICYTCESGKPKSEWGEYVLNQFHTFRKQVLDIADEMGSVPDKIIVSSKDGVDEYGTNGFFASLFQKSRRT